MADLRTDYKDDVLNTEVNKLRKYQMIQNDDGTVSFEDVTDYLQVGDSFGSADVNAITTKLTDGVLDSMEEIEANTYENKIAGALAVKEVIEELNKTTFNGAAQLLHTSVASSTTQQIITIPNYEDYNMLAIMFSSDTSLGGSTLIIPRALFGYAFPFNIDTSGLNSSYNIKTYGHINIGKIVLQKMTLTGWSNFTIRAYGIK